MAAALADLEAVILEEERAPRPCPDLLAYLRELRTAPAAEVAEALADLIQENAK